MARKTPRRRFLGDAGLMLAAAGFQQTPASAAQPAEPAHAPRRLRIVCVGAHPDDPESGCGGTLARYAEAGHRVTVIYLTRGEGGIAGRTPAEAARIRTAEAEAACKVLGARPVFAGQIDGATEINGARAQAMARLLASEAPDVVFTHWPLDTHPDHQAASLLTLRAYLSASRRFAINFFEVNAGYQTLGFVPAIYVDISGVREKKKDALFAHRSQNGENIFNQHHDIMARFRGREIGVAAAEAFATLARDNRSGRLPGLS
jgi:LmbE family N-acetylglucosaminyl deacetylase